MAMQLVAWLAALLAVAGLAMFGWWVWGSCSRWQRKQRRLDDLNKQHETLRSVRQDAVYHHGWANSRGDYKEADSHESHVRDIDKKLANLKRQFEAVEVGEVLDFDSVVVDDRLKNS
ncbi:unnamed protein product [Polarella glacialis]|uniref:Uncharacterized protein n=1 Tax=Polarella glacialis TaxID=89957 RepID=A0A813KT83_POLGL|nr:unnamed protein product [Polarella glacialis]CAE8714528.1 unnamed protein product [Polarella glacialis]|mmetsp:Transcript_36056/g.58179  ORF Transcript_36056/g.58179 Transcript_36056/m.58179 type:complete len:117 (+) Transcript_36056:65-415(+)